MTAKRLGKSRSSELKAITNVVKEDTKEKEERDDIGDDDDNDEPSVYDSEEYVESESDYDSNAESNEDEEASDDEDEDDDGFEDQGSSSEEEGGELTVADDGDESSDEEELEVVRIAESVPRAWSKNAKRGSDGTTDIIYDDPKAAQHMHTDDLSSDDDEDETTNRIGRVPLHWYDEYDHIGYDVSGNKIGKPKEGQGPGGLLDQVVANADDTRRFTVYDALHAREVEVSPRHIELLRRLQSGAYAHPEFDGNPEGIDYFSGVDREVSGMGADVYEKKSRFQPSKWEKLQVRRLLHRLKCGSITLEHLTGEKPKGSGPQESDRPFLLWKGDEEDELNARGKGPQHIAAPKLPPPGHAESYNPPDEYLPTAEDLEKWKDMEVADRPHGLLIPKKFSSLRAVGAYPFAVRERFERCLDLYLCPRTIKRRLNIDPESLVPSIPKAADLRPFPTTECIRYLVPNDNDETRNKAIRCLTISPDGQYLASGGADGYVRIWEVATSRHLMCWDLSRLISSSTADSAEKEEEKDEETTTATELTTTDTKATGPKPVVCLDWNPNPSNRCLLAAIGPCAVVLATGTGGPNDVSTTEALLETVRKIRPGDRHSTTETNGTQTPAGDDDAANENDKTKKVPPVTWVPCVGSDTSTSSPLSAFATLVGPVCILRTRREMATVQWHRKGDYFLTVSPKAVSGAAVLIHRLSRASSQQPFKKQPQETQCASFHPTKPFLFVAFRTDVRVYHLVKQQMVKRLRSGCKWISGANGASGLTVHPTTGDHVVIGSLCRRVVWFDLDLGDTPYRTLKYHSGAVRSVRFHRRYPLMASASDDGTVHVFHATVYSDLMKNPLLVPVKVLRPGVGTDSTNTKTTAVLDQCFHPYQPWLFSAGADGTIRLFQDL